MTSKVKGQDRKVTCWPNAVPVSLEAAASNDTGHTMLADTGGHTTRYLR